MDNKRPTPLLDDIDTTRDKLAQWFTTKMGHEVSIPSLQIPESTGMSNVTLLFDIEWHDNGQAQRTACVGRLQPEIARPVFPSYDLRQQYEVMAALGEHSEIPVPTLLGLETNTHILGVQFYIMRHTAGRIPGDMPPYNMDGWMLAETDEAQRATLWRAGLSTMARFHRLDYRQLGLSHLEVPGKTALQAQLDYWQNYLDWAMEGQAHPAGQAALDWLRANQPTDEPTALCWGDARIGNIIFTESLDEVAAVLDWEMATLGNPLQDLAWYNHLDATFAEGLGMPRLPGLPSYEDTIAQWQRETGFDTSHYAYYEIFAAMRFGVIMSRIMLATGQDSEIHDNFAIALMNKRLQAAGGP